MIGRFRTSLERWLDSTLTADVYVSLADRGGAPTASREAHAALLTRVAAIEGVGSIALSRSSSLPTPRGDITVRGVRPDDGGFGLSLTSGAPGSALTALAAGEGIAVSERLAYRDDLEVGEPLVLPTIGGNRAFPIVAVFRDFNTGNPGVVLALETYRDAFADEGLDGIGVRAAPDADVAELEQRVRRELAREPRAGVRSSQRLRELSLSVFDRTFKITEVLRVLAGLVAFLGVLSALLAIELERGRERAVLRALGLAPRALRTLLVTETGLLGAAAGIAAIPLGIALAAVLVHVINRRSFGWSMDLLVTPGPLVTGFALALGAALVAGLVPAWRATRMTVSRGLREE
jgi:putative ABC transport system permease protein